MPHCREYTHAFSTEGKAPNYLIMKGLIRFRENSDGKIVGWRIAAAATLIGGAIGTTFCIRSGWTPESMKIAMFVTAVGAVLGGMFWGEQVLKRRRGKHNSESVSQGMRRFLAATSMLAILGIMAGVGLKLATEWASLWWPSTSGTVVSVSSSKEYRGFSVVVEVHYEAAGVRRTAKLKPHGLDVVSSSAEVQRLEQRYPAGSVHSVYFKPSAPQVASLRCGPTLGACVASVTVPLFGVAGIVALGKYGFGRRRAPVGGGRSSVAVAIKKAA